MFKKQINHHWKIEMVLILSPIGHAKNRTFHVINSQSCCCVYLHQKLRTLEVSYTWFKQGFPGIPAYHGKTHGCN